MGDEDQGVGGKSTIAEEAATFAAAVAIGMTPDFQINFAFKHMSGAARFCRRVGEVEQQYVGAEWDTLAKCGAWGEIMHSAIACVLTSVASLEAYANELYSDHATIMPTFSPKDPKEEYYKK